MRIAIAGAGLAGLVAALCLARDGLEVVLVEPDPPSPDVPADELCAQGRPGAPQAPHPHNFLPLARRLLAEQLPDVHAQVLERGGAEIDMRAHLPAGEPDEERERDLQALAVRRPLLEHLLRQAALREPGITWRPGRATSVDPDGLDTTDGHVRAGLVVDAAGRRSPLPAALVARGEPVRVHEETCGITYVTRHYRLRGGLPGPLLFGLAARAELPYLVAALFLGDDRTFSVIVGTPPADRELRRVLVDPTAYDAALSLLPPQAPWVAPDAAAPLGGVRVMGGLSNTLVETGELGVPYVGIGDAVLTTNPRFGWGASLALLHVSHLREALRGPEPARQARAAVHADAGVRWQASVDDDRARCRWWAGGPWEPMPAACLAHGGQTDRAVAVAAVRRLGLLDPPDGYLATPYLRDAVARAERELRERGPLPGPTREQVMHAGAARLA